VQGDAHLMQVVLTRHPAGGLAGGLDGGQQQANKNADDRDDNQQFNECESVAKGSSRSRSVAWIRVDTRRWAGNV
jgi:hypothetical protein